MLGFFGLGKLIVFKYIVKLIGVVIIDYDVLKFVLLKLLKVKGIELMIVGGFVYDVEWVLIDFYLE